MALTRFGDTGPVFGLIAESTGFIQDFNQKRSYDEAIVDNNIGETVTSGYFNGRWEGSFTLIEKNGSTMPDITSTVISATIANLTTITKGVIPEADGKPEQKGFQKTTYSYKAWDNISL